MGLAVLKTMSDAARSAPGSDTARVLDAVLLTAAVGLLADLVLYALILLMPPQPEEVLVRPFFYRMDAPLLLIAVATLFAIRFIQPPAPLAAALDPAWRHPKWAVALAMAVVVVLGTVGASLVTSGVHLSRDEQMAAADAVMLAGGNLMNPIPVEWRPYADALQFLFVQFADGATHWASFYFPINAWLRSLFLSFGHPDAANPVVAAIAVWLAYDIARTLWPDRRDAAIVAALLVAVSPQVLVTAMTPYAMTLHLTLTLLWLRFWMRNDLTGHIGAIVTGAVATGIHQIAFHALFVAPFVLGLWLAKRYRLALVYTLSYAVIGLAWLKYWSFAAWFMGATLPVAPGGGFAELVGKIVPVLQDLSIAGFLYVPLFVLKFVAWQHILFLPLLLAAFSAWRAMPSVLRLSLAAAGLTLAVVFVIMPYQGHGWGYRYLHGFIGPFALACAYGWVVLTKDTASGSSRRLRPAMAAATAMTLLVSLPVLAAELRRYHAPYAAAEAHLRAQSVDVVVIDHLGSRAGSLVANAADLSNKPKMMALSGLDDAQLRSLCARYSVAFFGIDHMRAFGLDAFERSVRPGIMRTLDHRRQVLRDAGCTAEVPLPAVTP